jgi:hypothetical protein
MGLARVQPLGKLAPYLVSVVLCLTITSAAMAASPKTIVFYDPDANHQAIVAITARINKHLKSVDPDLVFQPIQSRKDFENYVKKNRPGFAIVSSQVLRTGFASRMKLTPFLVPESEGEVVYRKVLVSRSKELPKNLRGISTAVAILDKNPKAAGKAALRLLDESGYPTGKAIVVPVSKDIDALLALSFGQVKAALVTPKSMKVLMRINPSAGKSLIELHETNPILRSPLCRLPGNAKAKDAEILKKAFGTMADSKPGREAMALLGIQKWVDFQKSMWKQ